jgi:signal transduction histidine kinase
MAGIVALAVVRRRPTRAVNRVGSGSTPGWTSASTLPCRFPLVRRSDWAWPLGILVVGSLEMVALWRGLWTLDARRIGAANAVGGIALETVSCALLVLRRRWPLTVALTASVPMSGMPAFGIHMDEPVTPILILGLGMFAVGRYRRDRWAYIAPLGAALAPYTAKWADYDGRVDVSDFLFILSVLSAPFAFGRLTLRQDKAHRREAARVRREAIATERDRIARELHDVLAHSISSMVLQANVAADTAADDRSAWAFTSIAETGRSALADVATMLRLLRAGDQHEAPTPTAADLPTLVERFRRAGLVVEPAVIDLGESRRGAAVEMSVYRIVQEALTNAVKHAGAGPTGLHITDGDAGVSIEVTSAPPDAADGPGRRIPGAGHGLLGMRERVEMFGGTLHAAPGPDGRFQIRAHIPHQATA